MYLQLPLQHPAFEQIYLSKRILSGEKLMLSPVNNTVGTVTC